MPTGRYRNTGSDPSLDTSDGDGDGGGGGGTDDDEGLSRFDVRQIVVGMVVSGIATVLITVVDQLLSVGGQIRQEFGIIGLRLLDAPSTVSSVLLGDLLPIPFEALDSVVAASGPLAPIVAAVTWALTAAIIAGILWTIWRILGWL